MDSLTVFVDHYRNKALQGTGRAQYVKIQSKSISKIPASEFCVSKGGNARDNLGQEEMRLRLFIIQVLDYDFFISVILFQLPVLPLQVEKELLLCSSSFDLTFFFQLLSNIRHIIS